jgi:transposase
MAKAYSNDLRERAAVLVAGGLSCRNVAALLGVSVASVVRWSQRSRATGSAAAKPLGHRRPRLLAGQQDWLLARLKAVPDLTLRALVAELRERGVVTSYGSVWRTVRDARLSFKKKDAVRKRARPA